MSLHDSETISPNSIIIKNESNDSISYNKYIMTINIITIILTL